jgi:hypothetical protein
MKRSAGPAPQTSRFGSSGVVADGDSSSRARWAACNRADAALAASGSSLASRIASCAASRSAKRRSNSDFGDVSGIATDVTAGYPDPLT